MVLLSIISGIMNTLIIIAVLMLMFRALLWFRIHLFEKLVDIGDNIVVPHDPDRSWIGNEMAFSFPTFYNWYLKIQR